MTLDLISRHCTVALDDLEEGSLFELTRELGVDANELHKIEDNYYGSYSMGAAQIEQLQNEVTELRQHYRARAAQRLVKQKKIHAKDPAVRERIVAQMLVDDPWLRKFDAIIDACQDALATDRVLVSVGD